MFIFKVFQTSSAKKHGRLVALSLLQSKQQLLSVRKQNTAHQTNLNMFTGLFAHCKPSYCVAFIRALTLCIRTYSHKRSIECIIPLSQCHKIKKYQMWRTFVSFSFPSRYYYISSRVFRLAPRNHRTQTLIKSALWQKCS